MAEQPPQSQQQKDMFVPRESVFLILLEHIFQSLVVLKEAYQYMYPKGIPQHRYPPCIHSPDGCPGHLFEMAGQGERMVFVGMLLRTADIICWHKEQSLKPNAQPTRQNFEHKVNCLKKHHPGIARGVAVLNFLTAGLCQNDMPTLRNLLDLVRALRESSEKCTHDHHPFHGRLYDYYNRKNVNCTLILIGEMLVHHCTICYSNNGIEEYERKLAKCLRPSKWHGCSDCESMLVDILIYTKMLERTNNRMMASLRLSFRCVINSNHSLTACQEDLKTFTKTLFEKGFTEVKHCESLSLDNTHLEISLDYETIYMSGYQADKKDGLRTLLDEFLEEKRSRVFFIQLRHQFIGNDGLPHCCEPQIMEHLEVVLRKVAKADFAQFIKVHMMLEQDPCHTCRREVMPVILNRLGDHRIPPQLVTMLEYVRRPRIILKQSPPIPPFLKRLTCGHDHDPPPIRLKSLMNGPFEKRHGCIVCGMCRYIRCRRHFRSLHTVPCLFPGHYSMPSIAPLTVDRLRYHTLQFWPAHSRTEPYRFIKFNGVSCMMIHTPAMKP